MANPSNTSITRDEFAEMLTVLSANQPRRQKTVAEHVVRSAFNPTGKKRTIPVFYVNGVRQDEKFLHDAEIALLGKLKVGRFCNSLVTVRQNTTSVDREFHIDYSNSSADKKMRLMQEFRSFLELLQRLTTEQPAE